MNKEVLAQWGAVAPK